VKTAADVYLNLERYKPGDTVMVTVNHEGAPKTVSVVLAKNVTG
jgi:hypothetical protein